MGKRKIVLSESDSETDLFRKDTRDYDLDTPLSKSGDLDIPLSKTVTLSHKKLKTVKNEDEVDEETSLSGFTSNTSVSSSPVKRIKKESKSKSKTKTGTEPKFNTKAKTSLKKEVTESKLIKEETPGEQNAEGEVEEDEEEEEEEEYKWWEDNENDGSVQWTTFRHNGVLFPPVYVPLPSHIKLYYDGNPVDLPPAAEEVAGFYAGVIGTDHEQNPIFRKNFFTDFKKVLQENGGTLNGVSIENFSKCDFSRIVDYLQQQKEIKKQLSAQEKKQLRIEKEEFEEPYKFCEVNGRREQVGNFRVEPPDLFRGRGAHPKTGKLKRRIYPEDIVLNLDKDAPIPPVPEGHHWGEIKHDNTVQWLAMWRENISNSFKYVRLAANSSFKGQSDLKKFEKARELKKHINTIRRDYKKNMKNKLMVERQKAVAIYLIDVFALRAGGEKSDDEADTVGCCSLRYEHVTLKPPQTVIFDFLGKDSIRFYQEVEVEKQVFKNLAIFKRLPKKPGDQLFDRLDPSILNKFLQNYMPGLTAKVFRTYNASKTMQDQLDLIPNKGSVAEKLLKYNAANRTVAILCNHQRTISKTHKQTIEKASDRIRELEWQAWRLKKAMVQIDADAVNKSKNKKFLTKVIKTFTKTEQKKIHKLIIDRENDRVQKRYIRENDAKKFENEEELGESVLKEWLQKVEEKKIEYNKEVESDEIEITTKINTVEKIEKQLEKLKLRIETSSIQLKDREENSQVSLGTSKINYIDPRLSVVFCKKYDIPIEKIFTKTLREKFKWAIESVDENWRF
ncbi:hypothetical protein TPHA_0J00430 [Tetrapisispora phaffii CBS 4417]|uniref:DNA topoisomerase I n=1 Tax=Tetrapisispora phaffii (strain ATCC 24235 / CBS 4417 / NBRC 1672 / NRRL Y-8282 / UCD 70-5) TaxID=1071381 RepID=G8BYC4_TETPH|nr:hypothetical protein TPHA_0J00430 [Tetrapisispora phaffii CBS 4417]CCE64866.1 hypothetical protein TPHA_0J00430 [Tetrapisispora phaffii CBS 4417]